MLAYINNHFNPSAAVDTLSSIFDLIDLKQKEDKQVVSLKAQFLWVFATLKMGGISIDLALQVGFMLRALISRIRLLYRSSEWDDTLSSTPRSKRWLINAFTLTKIHGLGQSGKTGRFHVIRGYCGGLQLGRR